MTKSKKNEIVNTEEETKKESEWHTMVRIKDEYRHSKPFAPKILSINITAIVLSYCGRRD